MLEERRITLTEKDIKLIKEEKKFGYALPFLLVGIALFFSLAYIIIEPYGSMSVNDYIIIVIVDCLLLISALFVLSLMNSKYNEDLLVGKKDVIIKQVTSKLLYKQKYYIVIDNKQHETDKKTFDKINEDDYIETYYSPNSKLYLGIEVKNTN